MSALSDKGITLEGLAAAVDSLRQELATWKALAHKQDQLSADQITATQSGATAAKISQIAVNTAAIQSLAAQVAGQISLEYVATLPATGEPLTLYLVPQGDGTAPNFCNEYLWVNNDWELIGTTGAMANNGELTIQVNGVTVGTFTANQATNAAVNITVPTNTNQLVNGAGYVDTAALQAALALKQNSLNTAQLEAVNSGITAAAVQQIADNATAITGKQDALTVAQQAAVDSGATVAKIDQIAANASAIVSLTSSKQDSLTTTQLAAVNSGITASAVQQIGTNAYAIATKAADADVVHLAGAETITGDKTYDANLIITGNHLFAMDRPQVTMGTIPSSVIYWGVERYRDSGGASFCLRRGYVGTAGSMGLWTYVYAWSAPTESVATSLTISADGSNSEYTVKAKSFKPYDKSVTNCGTSEYKFATFNGINPGALSFPSASTVDLSGSITDLNGGINEYTPAVDGWVQIVVPNAADAYLSVRSYYSPYSGGVAMGNSSTLARLCITVPVRSGIKHVIYVKAASITSAVFRPCQGNV